MSIEYCLYLEFTLQRYVVITQVLVFKCQSAWNVDDILRWHSSPELVPDSNVLWMKCTGITMPMMAVVCWFQALNWQKLDWFLYWTNGCVREKVHFFVTVAIQLITCGIDQHRHIFTIAVSDKMANFVRTADNE